MASAEEIRAHVRLKRYLTRMREYNCYYYNLQNMCRYIAIGKNEEFYIVYPDYLKKYLRDLNSSIFYIDDYSVRLRGLK